MKKTLADVMTPLPQTVGKEATLEKAVEIMESTPCSHLPVLNGGRLCGIISDKDIRAYALKNMHIKVGDIMTLDPILLMPEDDVKAAMKVMVENDISSVLIRSHDNTPWGIFTATDALKICVAQSVS